ncbi:MAG: hypothetical protein P8N43_13140 [Alphaproteobacteria bacterium]|nr:hypothetical protein [Alphaproteobacteria bacterium]
MKTLANIAIILASFVLLVPLGFIAYGFLTYKDVSVYTGDAYGFVIGETYQDTFDRAVQLKNAGKIEEIRRWPKDSSPFAFSSDTLSEAMSDARWSMEVDSDWWNNSIRLEFQDGRLAEIHRFRLCCELP